MTAFNFLYPITIRYGDLDPQGHVNNACFLTYFEQARVHYLIHLGLFDRDQSFMDVGIILAEVRVTYLTPVNFGMSIQVGAGTTRLGNKSIEMAYSLLKKDNNQVLATGSAVLVTFDYRARKTILIPNHWRERISAFENL